MPMIPSIENLVTDQMRACIGKTSPVMELPEEISASDVRRYVEATGDRNPLWMDDAMPWAGIELPPNFTNTRNAGHEVEWLEPVYVGDRLTIQYRLVDVYARQGRSGPMLFLKRACEIRNQDGRLVVRVTSTSAKLPAARFSGAGSAPA